MLGSLVEALYPYLSLTNVSLWLLNTSQISRWITVSFLFKATYAIHHRERKYAKHSDEGFSQRTWLPKTDTGLLYAYPVSQWPMIRQ